MALAVKGRVRLDSQDPQPLALADEPMVGGRGWQSSIGASASATVSDPGRLAAGLIRKKSSPFWPPGTCLCQPVCVYLYKLRRSCARSYGGCDLFQLGCNGVKSSVEGPDKSCARAAKDLSNQEETTRKGRALPVSRKGPLYHLPGHKAFPHRGLCAGEPKTRCAKSCIRLWARGGYQR